MPRHRNRRSRRILKLGRRRHRREPKRRFVLFCEGKKTEPAYFFALKALYSNALIEIETIPDVGVPLTVARKAKERARDLGITGHGGKTLESYEKNDQVWAVFDRDAHPNFSDAVTMCRAANVQVARSNPCFEVWLILHEVEYDKPDHRRAVQIYFESLRPEYKRRGSKTPDCANLVTRVEIAEQRARVLLERRVSERSPFGMPSTTVGHLTKEIRTAAKQAT